MSVKSLKRNAKDFVERMTLPPMAKLILRRDEAGLSAADPGPQRIIDEGIAWIARAQDGSRSKDGGVARHFSPLNGWAHSYPETTGYIVPTMIAYGRETKREEAIARARRMLDWLVSIQFPEGGFQGGTVDQVPRVPVTFNTGQILMGLAAGAALDPYYREPMRRAADWLVATQDKDGCWRRHPTPFAAGGEKAYETHVALGLMDAASVDPNRGYLEAALKQVDWALTKQQANGWLADCCLDNPRAPLAHTLGYALRGVVGAYLSSREDRFLQAAIRTAEGLMPALSAEGRLPGRLDAAWRPAADWVCLTGSVQIAHCWLLLFRETRRREFLDAGRRANAFVRRTIAVDGPPEIRGGVKGSFPINGGYGRWQYLNWSCKFAIDSNREELALAAEESRADAELR